MNKETVKRLLSSSSGEDQRLGLEYLQYLEDQEIEEIVPLYANGTGSFGFPNKTTMRGYINLRNSYLLIGISTISRYDLPNMKRHLNNYNYLNKNLTLWQENQLIQQNRDK